MEARDGREVGDRTPSEERRGGDEVAGPERSGRGRDAGPGQRAPGTPRRTARTAKEEGPRAASFRGEQRLLIFDARQPSDLTATDFAPLVGVTRETLYPWRRRFEAEGPAGLVGFEWALMYGDEQHVAARAPRT